jgi:hypothetical protein
MAIIPAPNSATVGAVVGDSAAGERRHDRRKRIDITFAHNHV